MDSSKFPTPLRDNPSKGVGGLVNMGLTCYANAVLQAFRHCAKASWILEEGRYDTLFEAQPKPKRATQQTFTRAFAEITQMLWKCDRGQCVRPGDFWRKVTPLVSDTIYEHFATRAPHDSHEFFLFLLDSVHEATAQDVEMRILRPPAQTEQDARIHQALQSWQREFSKQYSPFVDIFYGLSHWRTTCQRCGTVSHRWESFNTLKAVVPHGGLGQEPPSITALLEEELRPETIEGYHCEKCPERTAASRSFRIWRLPQTVVVALKRFTPEGRKVPTRVAPLPAPAGLPQMDFTSFFSEESPERHGQMTYTLRSIVDHHGSAGGGHYTAQARHLGEGKWYLYDDESSQEMPGGPIFGETTYLLFLERGGDQPLKATAA